MTCKQRNYAQSEARRLWFVVWRQGGAHVPSKRWACTAWLRPGIVASWTLVSATPSPSSSNSATTAALLRSSTKMLPPEVTHIPSRVTHCVARKLVKELRADIDTFGFEKASAFLTPRLKPRKLCEHLGREPVVDGAAILRALRPSHGSQ